MVDQFLFVSCDVVAHSAEPDLAVQLRQAQGINDIVRRAIDAAGYSNTAWFSGGDGGHVAFAHGDAGYAIQLVIDLRDWSLQAGVPLRIAACSGAAQRFSGADGRGDMVGPGLSLAAHLLRYASEDRVVVTDEFRNRCIATCESAVEFHDRRTLRGRSLDPQTVWLLSMRERFASRWDRFDGSAETPQEDDRRRLRDAAAHKDGLATLYRAKRLLQVNTADADALHGIREQMRGGAGRISSSSMLTQLFADPRLGQAFMRAAVLVERARGDVLCRAGDEGRTMFLVLRGGLAGFLPIPGRERAGAPDFTLGPGDLAGEMAFALRARRTATLICTEDTALVAIGQQDLFAAASTSPVLEPLKHAVDGIVCARIVQNLCQTVEYLGGSTRTGPLGGLDRPWIELIPYCRTITITWQQRDIRFDASPYRDSGLYVLVGGKLGTVGGTRYCRPMHPSRQFWSHACPARSTTTCRRVACSTTRPCCSSATPALRFLVPTCIGS